MINSTLRIINYGQSVFLMAIKNTLTNRLELEVIRLRYCPPETSEKIIVLKPHLVVVE